MIHIVYEKGRDGIVLRCTGHAGSAPPGKDTVCAGFSAMICALAAVSADSGAHARLASGSAEISCERPNKRQRTVFDAYAKGLYYLAAALPQYAQYEEHRAN